jgi:hypothetical protein
VARSRTYCRRERLIASASDGRALWPGEWR